MSSLRSEIATENLKSAVMHHTKDVWQYKYLTLRHCLELKQLPEVHHMGDMISLKTLIEVRHTPGFKSQLPKWIYKANF